MYRSLNLFWLIVTKTDSLPNKTSDCFMLPQAFENRWYTTIHPIVKKIYLGYCQVVTEAFVVLSAMEILCIDGIGDVPTDYGGSLPDREKFLLDLSRRIVSQSWDYPEEDDVRQAMAAYQGVPYHYCTCGEGVFIDRFSIKLSVNQLGVQNNEVPTCT